METSKRWYKNQSGFPFNDRSLSPGSINFALRKHVMKFQTKGTEHRKPTLLQTHSRTGLVSVHVVRNKNSNMHHLSLKNLHI